MSDILELRCGRNLLAAMFSALEDAEDPISLILAEKLQEAMIGCIERDAAEKTLYFSKDDNGNAQLLRIRVIWQTLCQEMAILNSGIRVMTDSLVKEGDEDV